MSNLRKALKQGCNFTITMQSDYIPVVIAKHGDYQLFIQRGIKELNLFELLEGAAQSANRLLAEKSAQQTVGTNARIGGVEGSKETK